MVPLDVEKAVILVGRLVRHCESGKYRDTCNPFKSKSLGGFLMARCLAVCDCPTRTCTPMGLQRLGPSREPSCSRGLGQGTQIPLWCYVHLRLQYYAAEILCLVLLLAGIQDECEVLPDQLMGCRSLDHCVDTLRHPINNIPMHAYQEGVASADARILPR